MKMVIHVHTHRFKQSKHYSWLTDYGPPVSDQQSSLLFQFWHILIDYLIILGFLNLVSIKSSCENSFSRASIPISSHEEVLEEHKIVSSLGNLCVRHTHVSCMKPLENVYFHICLGTPCTRKVSHMVQQVSSHKRILSTMRLWNLVQDCELDWVICVQICIFFSGLASLWVIV